MDLIIGFLLFSYSALTIRIVRIVFGNQKMNEYKYWIPLFGTNYSNSWIVRIIRSNTAAYEEAVSPGPDPDDNTDAEPGVTPEEENAGEDLEDEHAMTWPVRQELLDTEDEDYCRDAYRKPSITATQWQIPISDGILQSNWHRDNWDKICIGKVILPHQNQASFLMKIANFETDNIGSFYNKLAMEREARFNLADLQQAIWDQQGTPNDELNREFNHFKQWIAGKRFEQYLQYCKKPKAYIGKHQKEPCNSPHIVAYICAWGLKIPDNSRTLLWKQFYPLSLSSNPTRSSIHNIILLNYYLM